MFVLPKFPNCVLLCALTVTSLHAQNAQPTVKPSRWQRMDGFVPMYWDGTKGRIFFEIPKLNEDLLYFEGVSQGIGSVALGVDRGSTLSSAVIYFERTGSRVQVVERNLKFRAPHGNAALKDELPDSFATSVIASLPIESEQDEKLIVDATTLLLRDPGFNDLIRQSNQGSYKLDPLRSSIYLPRTKAFPRNTEVEVTMTYAADTPGKLLDGVAPDGHAVTLRLHHSFVKPPGPGFVPRVADIRIGSLPVSFKDYSAPYATETDTHWVERFRLEKRDSSAKVSEPKQPIVYYLDAGIPEPIRSAMRDGILWWNAAFEAAGYKNAIVVKDPTPDIDPMDVRYSFVFWVNRDERGFSVGENFTDPRTGEILSAKARMDSARIRTISTYWKTYRAAGIAGNTTEEQFVTLRQALVTAHEVGHTLGFPHTWNSSMNNRASVMEYPSPRIKLTADNKIDLSDAFENGIGELDKYMVRYSYTEISPSQEREKLNAIVSEMRKEKLLFTPPTDPRWNRYDDLGDEATYLRETAKQRHVLLDHYGLAALDVGEPVAHLRGEGLWMTYLHHRWAIDSGVRYIGGQYHGYAVKGDAGVPTEIVPAPYQRQILGLLIDELTPKELAIPESLLAQLTTDPFTTNSEYDGPRSTTAPEEFHVETGYAFDHLSAARTLADLIIGQLLKPETANRMIAFADRQEIALTLPEMITRLTEATWNAPRDSTAAERSLRRVTRGVLLDELMILGASPKASPETRAVVLEQLVQLKGKLAGMKDDDPVTEATVRQSERDVTRYLLDPVANAPKRAALPQPAGAPL